MGTVTVDDILITPLKRLIVAGGDVLHGMRRDDVGYVAFGEVYFSEINYGAIKAWKRHKRMTLNFVVPYGVVQFVFVDDEGHIRSEIVGAERYTRLSVPPLLWFGFRGLANPYSIIMNVADIPHDPNEVERKKEDDIAFNWEIIK